MDNSPLLFLRSASSKALKFRLLTGSICAHFSEMQRNLQGHNRSSKMYYSYHAVFCEQSASMSVRFQLEEDASHIYNHPLTFLTEVKTSSQTILTRLFEL